MERSQLYSPGTDRRRAALLQWTRWCVARGLTMSQNKTDVLHGTLALMILHTLDSLGPLHGWGIARRIEQTSGDVLSLNQGTLYPALLKLEQMGWISSEWGVSENNRRARFYKITRAGRKQLAEEEASWARVVATVGRFLKASEGSG
jgi:PadR family transcriptional regulator PadR